MAQRVDLLFSGESGYGWSESYWWKNVIPLSSYPGALQTLIQARVALLANDCELNYVRLNTLYTRSPILIDGAGPNGGALPGGTAAASGPDFVAITLRLTGAVGGIGRLFLRGVPEVNYLGDTLQFNTFYVGAVQDFSDVLTSSGNWGIRTSAVSTPRPRLPASGLIPVAPRGYSFLAQTSVVAMGDSIVMHNATVIGYNGRKQVVSITGTGPYIVTVGGASPQASDPGTNNPYYTTILYTYPSIASTTVERVTRRSAGRFFGQRRGRRSTTLPLRR
jgi:hypothetical protein